ncbi:hypothetical protein LTR78_004312 [Recurvomyces mirabilis]|uniref:Uncharacterized protein n=1 Tax=Recurvomyces mirabilis TaxID=574656 RepID=A0AAE1C2J1_9PEZI|nr:hypothetical protein LTR78_004312 [Recurvomyces mirabilis]KAK5156021.1 hypothetical protein LTS14_005587 [Recurvomyces mirabilis]
MAPSSNQPLKPTASSFNPAAFSFVPAPLLPAPQSWQQASSPRIVPYADKINRPAGPEWFNLYLLTPTTATIRYFPSTAPLNEIAMKTYFTTTISDLRHNDDKRDDLLILLSRGQLEWKAEVNYPFCLTVKNARAASEKDDKVFDFIFRLFRNQLKDRETGRTADWVAENLMQQMEVDVQGYRRLMMLRYPAVAVSEPIGLLTSYAFFDVWYHVDVKKAGIHASTSVSVVTETKGIHPYPSMRDPNPAGRKESEWIDYPHQGAMKMISKVHAIEALSSWSKDKTVEQIEEQIRDDHERILCVLDKMAEDDEASYDQCIRYVTDSFASHDPVETALKWQKAMKKVVPRERNVTDEMIAKRKAVLASPKETPLLISPADSGYASGNKHGADVSKFSLTDAPKDDGMVVDRSRQDAEEMAEVQAYDGSMKLTSGKRSNPVPSTAGPATQQAIGSEIAGPVNAKAKDTPEAESVVRRTDSISEAAALEAAKDAMPADATEAALEDDDSPIESKHQARQGEVEIDEDDLYSHPDPAVEAVRRRQEKRNELYALINADRLAAGRAPLSPTGGYRPPIGSRPERVSVWCPKRKMYAPSPARWWLIHAEQREADEQKVGEAKAAKEARRRVLEKALRALTPKTLPAWLRKGNESRERRWQLQTWAGESREQERERAKLGFRPMVW